MPAYDVSTLKFVKRGKVKEVYDAGDSQLLFQFSDRISVFDMVIPSLILGKGETLNHEATYWLEQAKRIGMQTHLVKRVAPDQMLVKKVGGGVHSFPMLAENKPDYGWCAGKDKAGYQIPLEIITRFYLTGSMWERVNNFLNNLEGKKVNPYKELGFTEGDKIYDGVKLPVPKFEATTKFEGVDRHLSDDEAMHVGGLTKTDWLELKESVLNLDELMNTICAQRGLIHVDGKKEFAFDASRGFIIIDTFGTADEDRFWDKKAYENSPEYQPKLVENSKEVARQIYKKTGTPEQRGYYDRLKAARNKGLQEPDIPPFTDEQIRQVVGVYVSLAEQMTNIPLSSGNAIDDFVKQEAWHQQDR